MSNRNPMRKALGAALAPSARFLRMIGLRPRRRPSFADNSRLAATDGQALIEAALTLPLVCAFMFTMIEACLAYYSYCMISESAREGTRYAMVHGATCTTSGNASCTATAASINSYVTSLGWPNLGAGTLSASTSFPNGTQNPGNPVQITVKYVFPINLPFVPSNSISMSSTSVMYIVQ